MSKYKTRDELLSELKEVKEKNSSLVIENENLYDRLEDAKKREKNAQAQVSRLKKQNAALKEQIEQLKATKSIAIPEPEPELEPKEPPVSEEAKRQMKLIAELMDFDPADYLHPEEEEEEVYASNAIADGEDEDEEDGLQIYSLGKTADEDDKSKEQRVYSVATFDELTPRQQDEIRAKYPESPAVKAKNAFGRRLGRIAEVADPDEEPDDDDYDDDDYEEE